MKVLLLDDQPAHATPPPLRLEGVEFRVAATPAEALRLLRPGGWAVVLLAGDFAGDGLALLPALRAEAGAPVVLLAAEPSLELVLRAIRLGAHEVLPRPVPPARLRELLRTLAGDGRVRELEAGAGQGEAILGSSPEMLSVFSTVARAASSDATVLVLGESGTGKEVVARVLHEQSRRAGGPFVAINCAAIPEPLLESELFGHEKGAFTGAAGRRIGRFERASGGTLFLDEVGDMSLALQAKILRALQERQIERVGGSTPVPIDVRIVAATHRELGQAVREGRFREDLFYRLAVVTLALPPLRARGADLDRLVEHYVALYARQHRRPIRAIAEATLEELRAYSWPGNVRQLRNAIERAVVMSSGEVLLPAHLPSELLQGASHEAEPTPEQGPLCSLAEMERRHILRALRESGHSLGEAAERLGIHRNTLRRKMAEYGLARAYPRRA